MMVTGPFNATRFAQKPLSQPSYRFSNVPRCEKDLKGSSLQYIDDRDAFHTCMAEMLLLCKEAMRRRPGKGTGSKPLSLEYLADRFDVDDPLFGYVVRTEENLKKDKDWQRGMMQGFITVTTFTTYQKSFKWDSHHPAAFSFEDEEMAMQRARGERAWDADNRLASALQGTVRCGDIWNEGIVWPRIAEISLLGGLGAGRALVSLVIEQLECMKASGKCNYDYVVLQATDNSVSFYESMGFVQVGAVAKDEKVKKSHDASDDEEAVAEPVDESSPEKPEAIARPVEIITSEVTTYTTQKAGETPADVAKQFQVDVWDIVFLNKDIYNELSSTSRLLPGTVLHIPVYPKPKSKRSSPKKEVDVPQWYSARENDTPRMIARMFDVSCLDLVEANKGRLEGLMSNSRLKEGTKIKISHLDVHEDEFKPYAHWSFPDDQFEDGEPSYMMALKLDRKKGRAASIKPFLESLAVSVSNYEPPTLLIPPSPVAGDVLASPTNGSKHRRQRHSDEPVPPKRPLSAYMIFLAEQRERCKRHVEGMSLVESSKYFGDKWRDLPEVRKATYEQMAAEEREKYSAAKAEYQRQMELWHNRMAGGPAGTLPESRPNLSLYNKVVRLKPGAMTEDSEYTYWYVLTFIPDLKWCHLAPMIQAGKFGADRPKHQGRPRWKLVDEKLGKEVDISSSFCIPIRSRAVRKTLDADKEEWDIIDDGTNPCEPKVGKARRWSMTDSDSEYTMSTDSSRKPARKSSATKPSAERRIRVSVGAGSIPPLVASYPGEKKSFYVRLSGHRLYDPSFEYPIRLKVGRPRGSTGKYTFKAKPKPPPQASIARVEASVSQPLQKRGRPTVSRNMPKQMEPEVQVPLLSGKKRKDPPPLDASDEVPKKRGPGRPKKSTQTTLFPFIRPSPIRPKRVANGEDASSTGQTIRTRRSLYDGDTAPPSASKNSSNAVIKRGPGRPPKRSKSVPPSLDRTEPAGDHGRRGRPPKRPESPDSSDSRQENRANTPKRRGRPPKRSKSVPPLSESRENVELPKRRGRPPKKATPIVSQDERPRRVAAPAFLGESPMSPYQAGTNPRRGRKRPMIEEESSVDDSFSLPTPVEQRTTRSKTSPSPSRSTRYSSRVGSGTQKSISPYLEIVPRKRRKVNSAGSRRTVLQN